jgi:hypothetical protein
MLLQHAGSSSYGGKGKLYMKQDHKTVDSGESTHDRPIVTVFPGRPGRGTGMRIVVRRFPKLLGTMSIQLQHVPN